MWGRTADDKDFMGPKLLAYISRLSVLLFLVASLHCGVETSGASCHDELPTDPCQISCLRIGALKAEARLAAPLEIASASTAIPSTAPLIAPPELRTGVDKDFPPPLFEPRLLIAALASAPNAPPSPRS